MDCLRRRYPPSFRTSRSRQRHLDEEAAYRNTRQWRQILSRVVFGYAMVGTVSRGASMRHEYVFKILIDTCV
jgi:hypothetical protein